MEVNVFMNILNLIAQFKQSAPEFLSSYCVINGAIMKLEEVENMGYEEYSLRSICTIVKEVDTNYKENVPSTAA